MISGLRGHDSARQFAVSRNQGYVAENTYEEVNRMEQQYWNEFLKTGGVCDYLGYKMEVYGHGENQKQAGREKQRVRKNPESVIIPLYKQEDDTA